ncbi:MAG: hypothetical protein ACYDA0_13415 [Candidatus Dormibacteraceae bacterium]
MRPIRDAEATRIEERNGSIFWDLSDQESWEHVVRVLERLRALGRLPLTGEQIHEIVLEKS